MPRSRTVPILLIGAAAAVASLLARRAQLSAAPAGSAMSELAIRNADIAFFTERVRRDPRGAADRAQLAALYLQRARETGFYADFVRAEEAARRSLGTRESRNTKSWLVLASSLLGQHRFREARAAAERLVALEPERDSYRALLGEIQAELGDYAAARATFGSLGAAAGNLAVAPRLARWAELEGRPELARAILLRARREALRRVDLPREQVAWFHLRLGDLALRHGRRAEARRALAAGLAVEPNDYRLLGAMARLSAATGEWHDVVRWGRRAAAVNADLATLGLLGDAYAFLGDTVRARHAWAELERAHAATPEPFARQWTSFRLDHRMRLAQTRAVLEREILERRDVLGYDLLAWARYLTGDLPGALAAAREAVRLGTGDAALLYHAGIIARAGGDTAAARRHLTRALAANPAFHHRDAAVARAVLDSLEAGR